MAFHEKKYIKNSNKYIKLHYNRRQQNFFKNYASFVVESSWHCLIEVVILFDWYHLMVEDVFSSILMRTIEFKKIYLYVKSFYLKCLNMLHVKCDVFFLFSVFYSQPFPEVEELIIFSLQSKRVILLIYDDWNLG